MQDVHDPINVGGLDIAIVGMAGRFPGAPDVEAFWRNIRDGVESVRHFTDDELLARGVPPEILSDPSYVKAGAEFEGLDRFDADFFGYTPRDAAQLDPQQRLFLECAWEALEHAGYDPQRCPRGTGIYAGCGASTYLMKHLLPGYALENDGHIADLLGLLSGNSADSLCTRVAYKLNLHGPAVSIQTACSTSLMAVHVACQALLGRECDMALAGGVSLNLLQNGGYRYQAGAIFSPDGHCRAFDAKAAGTLLGSGVGIIVLKRLEDAELDGDTIQAVIRGSAANNDGSDKVGFTAPSVQGQASAIHAAHAVAGISVETIGYVEAHGTGTALGDPIEIAALTQAFRTGTQRRQFCAIGSVKTNVGHLDAAAGIAGLIKTVLALEHKTLPPSLNFERPNPQINFANSPFYVNTMLKPWPDLGTPRRAGVSSFGIGGTNVHVIVEEAPPVVGRSDINRAAHVLPLSARTEDALRCLCRRLAQHLREHPDLSLMDVGHTLFVGRKRFDYRSAVLVQDVSDAIDRLEEEAASPRQSGRVLSERPTVAFLFPGQGAQHMQMGRSLYECEPVFRRIVDYCCERLMPVLGVDLREALYPRYLTEAEATQRLNQTAITQPALFVIEYAMAQLWMNWGVKPDALLGHSVGEYVAACLAGVFSVDDALEIVALRGRLLQATQAGVMLAVNMSEADVQPYLQNGCYLAAVNAADLCVLSGSEQAIGRVEQNLEGYGVAVRRLHVSHAFHSAFVEPMLSEFEARFSQFKLSAPSIPFVSNLSGRWIAAEEACSPSYWAQHVRDTVRFADGLHELLAKPDRILLEVGPGESLSSLARRHPDAGERRPILASQCHPQRGGLNPEQPVRCVAQLWVSGIEINTTAWFGTGRRRVPLSTYPFERQSYWIKPPIRQIEVEASSGSPVNTNVTASNLADWFYVPIWKRTKPCSTHIDMRPESTGSVLILSDAVGLGEELLEHWMGLQRPLVRVQAGKRFTRLGARHYAVRPGDREDLERLLRETESEIGPVSDICHLWSLGRDDASLSTEEILNRGFYSLLALAQALDATGQIHDKRKLSLTVVTNAVEDVTGTEPLCAEKATLHGPCKVIPQEYPNIACRLVDVELGDDSLRGLAQRIVGEMQYTDHESVVAYRGPHRWIKTFERLRRNASYVPRLHKHGVYLITGGLGGIGLTLAKHLAKEWQARLVLIGRSPLPPKQQWNDIVKNSTCSASVHAKLKLLLELESLGGELLPVQADIADVRQMHTAIEAARLRFGTLNGVIHAAGEAGGGLILHRSRTAIERVFAAKLHGTRNLLEALDEVPLDFVLLCSSLTAITGGAGQIDYCAANGFLDALAAKTSRQAGKTVFSVNWDVWREVGMAAGQTLRDGIGIYPAQAAALLETLLSHAECVQTLISTLDLEHQFAQTRFADLADRVLPEPCAKQQKYPRPALRTAYIEPTRKLEQGLASLWIQFLGITPVGIDDNLFELGGDSLLAIQLLAKVCSIYGVDIHPAAFLKTPTIAGLAVLVESRLIEEIEHSTTVAEPAHASAIS